MVWVIPVPEACCAFCRKSSGISTVIFRAVAMMRPSYHTPYQHLVWCPGLGLTVGGGFLPRNKLFARFPRRTSPGAHPSVIQGIPLPHPISGIITLAENSPQNTQPKGLRY